MAKSKGASKRARSRRAPADHVELGAGPIDVVGPLLQVLGPRLADALVARLSAPPAAPAPEANGRLIRIETQLGYLSNGHHALDNRTKALAAEVEELRQRLAAVERH